MGRVSLIFMVCLFFSACQERVGLAPVSEARSEHASTPTTYRVRRYDTLYSIAFRYEKDYRAIAQMNGFYPPYALKTGQIIYLKIPALPRPVVYQPRVTNRTQTIRTPPHNPPLSRLRWPCVYQHIFSYFSPGRGQKGINILGRSDGVIYASAPGIVAYAGDGLNGYGNLIIIKHNDKLLTAYAHNARLFVKEGQHVLSGQKIATMGRLDRTHWGVHYEVREWGRPVNPLNYLSKISSDSRH